VCDGEGFVDDSEPLVQLLLGYAEWWIGHHVPPPDHGVDAVVEKVPLEGTHLITVAVERCHRFHGPAVANQLQDAE
jgi:hypothetical protein